jgi:hypothetical protein
MTSVEATYEGPNEVVLHRYPEASVILRQLGVLENLGAVLEPLPA